MNELVAELEEWRPTWHPHYEVSNLGRVRSWARLWRSGEPRILRPGIGSHGYPTVVFGRQHGSQSVHVLVAAAFIGPKPEGQEVRHRDDDRTNPRADNLEYGTRHQNCVDMMVRERRHYTLNPEKVREIREMLPHYSIREIAAEYRVDKVTINRIAKGEGWAHVQ